MTPLELANLLFGDGGPPDREVVLNQGYTRDPEITKNALPDPRLWPQEFDLLPITNGRIRIDRRLVFTIAKRVINDAGNGWGAAQLHTAAAVWGAKPGQNTHRAFKPLSNPHAPERLTKALQLVQGGGALSGYKAMLAPRGRLNIPYMASSFFTKFLYFGGWDAKPPSIMPQPLIMDDDVVDALRELTREPWQRDSAEDYGRYIELAKDVAYEAKTSADVVEWRLWGWLHQ
ncbi:hypothetical protein MAHJHV65_41230 [Mycobacterium avium subsp. hominissuis]|uniref:8-oxoguanine DNA glycosylase OGG fold protein n=1 Tax=Mycobacterium avium TaxID=1764 RepID=UPI000B197E72|nr:hypothetical protein [Mycobacterium avium]